jgi:broad specificity phosphatase PhoE
MFLLRHGQSYFNLHYSATRVDPGIEDPELTPLGREQAAGAALALRDVGLSRVVISPFTRALQTAAPILATHDVAVEIRQDVRERAAFSCDIGARPEVLAKRFPKHEFTHLPSMWWYEGVETERETILRADAFRSMMAGRDDASHTLLVSHWAFILALTGASLTNGELMEYDPHSPAPGRIDWQT